MKSSPGFNPLLSNATCTATPRAARPTSARDATTTTATIPARPSPGPTRPNSGASGGGRSSSHSGSGEWEWVRDAGGTGGTGHGHGGGRTSSSSSQATTPQPSRAGSAKADGIARLTKAVREAELRRDLAEAEVRKWRREAAKAGLYKCVRGTTEIGCYQMEAERTLPMNQTSTTTRLECSGPIAWKRLVSTLEAEV
jgi:hypothetical protein